MKRTPLRKVSEREAARKREHQKRRIALARDVGHCELCGHDFNRGPKVAEGIAWTMQEHHIIRGTRPNARCAVLLLCGYCHTIEIHNEPHLWPDARQLALLRASRPGDFNLEDFNRLKGCGPDRVTEEDVNNAKPPAT